MSEVAAETETLRSRVHALLGELLAGPPRAELVERLTGIAGDPGGDALARAWHDLGAAARAADQQALDDEYHALFIGIARGELVPYASWYRTGLLMEQPLADVREDLRQFGIEREADVSEPEDHAAALLQVMALLSEPQSGAALEVQQNFAGRHLAPWIGRFLADLEAAPSADFYRSVARLGEAFLELEWRYLDIDAATISRHTRGGSSP